MTYRDNEEAVPFVGFSYTLQGGGFSTDELSITNGQDPDPRNRPGDVKWFGPGGSFSFSVGRKGSGQVRDWYMISPRLSVSSTQLMVQGSTQRFPAAGPHSIMPLGSSTLLSSESSLLLSRARVLPALAKTSRLRKSFSPKENRDPPTTGGSAARTAGTPRTTELGAK
jgi:hypothetical protein